MRGTPRTAPHVLLVLLLCLACPELCAERLALQPRAQPPLAHERTWKAVENSPKKRCCHEIGSEVSSSPEKSTSAASTAVRQRVGARESVASGVYLLTFGKYTGQALSSVPLHYLQWLVRSKVFEGRPGLHAALHHAGLLQPPPASAGLVSSLTGSKDLRPSTPCRVEKRAAACTPQPAATATASAAAAQTESTVDSAKEMAGSAALAKALRLRNSSPLRAARRAAAEGAGAEALRLRAEASAAQQQQQQQQQQQSVGAAQPQAEAGAAAEKADARREEERGADARGGGVSSSSSTQREEEDEKEGEEEAREGGEKGGGGEAGAERRRRSEKAHAWQSAAAHVCGLRKSTVTELMGGRRGARHSMTGSHFFNRSRPLSLTPSPRRVRAAAGVRDALSDVQSSLPPDILGAGCARLQAQFVRPLPASSEAYAGRLRHELQAIAAAGFEPCFLQVLEVLSLAGGMPCLVRGSAAASLVCYLLGISHLDPVREQLSLSRFLNALREELPDVDLDFPHDMRDTVFARLFQRFPAHSARISNLLHFRPRGAKREAARRLLHRQRIPRAESPGAVFAGPVRALYEAEWRALVGKFSGFSLHCGGVVLLPAPIPAKHFVPETNPHAYSAPAASLAASKRKFPHHQVKWDKRECQRRGVLKLDLLANRALTHLWRIANKHVYDYPSSDNKTAALLLAADTTGILYCESPAMKKALRLLRPTTRRQLALALAIIRPAGRSARRLNALPAIRSDEAESLVFDDDAIEYIQKLVGCSEDQAEMIRKGCGKGNASCVQAVEAELRRVGREEELASLLEHSKQYSFCKSHALSYAHLVWALAYEKAHNLTGFWTAHASAIAADGAHVYRSWVYRRASILAGLPQAESRQRRLGELTSAQQYKQWGYWLAEEFLPGCHCSGRAAHGGAVAFRGLWATGRLFGKDILFVTLGVANGEFVDVHVDVKGLARSGQSRLWDGDIIEGRGYWRSALGSEWIEASNVTVVTLKKPEA